LCEELSYGFLWWIFSLEYSDLIKLIIYSLRFLQLLFRLINSAAIAASTSVSWTYTFFIWVTVLFHPI
jgi:hypothetical protein